MLGRGNGCHEDRAKENGCLHSLQRSFTCKKPQETLSPVSFFGMTLASEGATVPASWKLRFILHISEKQHFVPNFSVMSPLQFRELGPKHPFLVMMVPCSRCLLAKHTSPEQVLLAHSGISQMQDSIPAEDGKEKRLFDRCFTLCAPVAHLTSTKLCHSPGVSQFVLKSVQGDSLCSSTARRG